MNLRVVCPIGRLGFVSLFLLLGAGACSGPPSGKVERVAPAGAAFALGKPIQVKIGKRESFVHRYRFDARQGERVEMSIESGGLALELEIAPEGGEVSWKEGPAGRIRKAFLPAENGPHDLVVRGHSLTFNNVYQLVVGKRRLQ